MSPEDVRLSREGLAVIGQILEEGAYHLVILDEADIAVFFGLIGVDELIELIDMKPYGVELVFTGRKADPRLIECADLVTEMREVKHYYRNGVIARAGIES